MDILNFLPKAYFPNRVFFGEKSTLFLRTIQTEKRLFVISQSFNFASPQLVVELGATPENTWTHSGEPSREDVQALEMKVAEQSPTWIIAVGGGSILDLVKVVKKRHPIQMLAIPTTLGSGTEVSQHVVYVEENRKKVESDYKFLPEVVLLTPKYLNSLSSEQIVYQSIDALAHGLESLVSKMANPFSDLFATSSIKLIHEQLMSIPTTELPSLAQLHQLQLGGFMAGLAQSSAATGLTHSFAHHFGPKLKLPHAQAVASFLIDVVKLNTAHTDKYQKLKAAQSFGNQDPVTALEKLFEKLKIQVTSFTLADDIDESALAIQKDVCSLTNPYPPSLEEITAIIQQHRTVLG